MALVDELVELEKRLWTEGPDAYREIVSERCLIALTPMAGVMSANEVAETVSEGPRWREPELEVRGVLEPAPGFAILTYRARAKRGAHERYAAVVSSGYVHHDGTWKLSFHQQTPDREAIES